MRPVAVLWSPGSVSHPLAANINRVVLCTVGLPVQVGQRIHLGGQQEPQGVDLVGRRLQAILKNKRPCLGTRVPYTRLCLGTGFPKCDRV